MPDSSMPLPIRLAVSVVSHGHGHMVERLLQQLASLCARSVSRVILTQNIPEAEPATPSGGWPFELQVVGTGLPRGFGANHNRALRLAKEEYVCVLNPDVELLQDPFPDLLVACGAEEAGCAYPIQVDTSGAIQDSERQIPTPLGLFRRRFLRAPEARVEWVNAACILLPSSVWRDLGGFDEGYFMYCEDVDLCLRLRLRGLILVKAPVQIIHAGQRGSGRNLRHLAWHVGSLLRFWRSPVYRQAQQLLTGAPSIKGTIGTP